MRAALLVFPCLSAGCVDLLGDYHTCAEVDCTCEGPECEPQPGDAWTKAFIGDGSAHVGAAAPFGNDGLLLVGDFVSSISFGGDLLVSAGQSDCFVARLDLSGAHVWSRAFGGAGNDRCTAVATSAADGSVVIGGEVQTEDVDFDDAIVSPAGGTTGFFAKLSSKGSVLWAKGLGAPTGAAVNALAVGPEGSVYVAGSFPSLIDFGLGAPAVATAEDAYAARFDPQGNPLWGTTSAGIGVERATGIAVASEQVAIVTGTYDATNQFSAAAATGSTDVFAAAIASDGLFLWRRGFGGIGAEAPTGVAVTDAEEIAIAGAFDNTFTLDATPLAAISAHDTFAATFDAAGTQMWSRGLKDGGDRLAPGHVAFGANLLWIAGSYLRNGDEDASLTWLDRGGKNVDAVTFSAPGLQRIRGVIPLSATNVILVGELGGAFEVSGKKIVPVNASDVFVARLEL